MKRRHFLASLGGAALAGTGGGLYLYGDSLTEHAATPVRVAADTQSATGYRETGVDAIVVEEPLPGGLGTVVARNYLTEHEKAVELPPLGRQPLAVFVALTTPQIRVVGREFNPVAEMSTDDLLDLVRDNYDGIRNVRREDDGTVTVLGQSTTYARYLADVDLDGSSIEVDLYVSEAVETETALLTTVAAYPRELRSSEAENVRDLMESIVDRPPETHDPEETEPEDGDDRNLLPGVDLDGVNETLSGLDEADDDDDGGLLSGLDGDGGLLD